MRRSGAFDDAVEVELVEEDDDDPAAPAASAGIPVIHGTEDRAGRGRRVLHGVGLVVAVALGCGVVALNVSDVRQAAGLRAELAEAPGLLSPLGESLSVMWTTPEARPVGAAGGLILVTTDELQAYDANSGDLVWTRPASAGVAEVCTAGELEEAPGVVVCAATETARAADPDRTVTVTVLDPATGEELVRLQRPGSLLGDHLVGDDVVLALAQTDGSLLVERFDPASGATRWAYRSPVRVLFGDVSNLQSLHWRTDELVVVALQWLALDLETGEETDRVSQTDGTFHWAESVDLADGSTATWQAGLDFFSEPFQGGVVLGADGSERFALPAPPWDTEIDDRSAPGILLVLTPGAEGELRGLDARTGELLWRAESIKVRQALARVGGVAVVRDSSSVVAVRITDGRELWRVVTEQPRDIEALTDGDVILLVGRDERGRFVAGHNVRSGIEVWREDLPYGNQVTSAGGRLLVVGRFGLTVMG
jgi:outer membrane protein assembly factor BamB